MVVHVIYKGNLIRLESDEGDFDVFVNTKKVSPTHISNRGFGITELTSILIKFETIDGINLIWDGNSRLYINMTSAFRGKLVGLAGNFNSKTVDDFLTSSGDLAHSPVDFGNSWMIPDADCPKVSKDYSMTACESNHQVAKFAATQCSVMRSDIFAACHLSVDPDSYIANCKEDVCACNGHQDCLCAVLSAYSRACATEGIVIEGWRNSSKCGKLIFFCVLLFVDQ